MSSSSGASSSRLDTRQATSLLSTPPSLLSQFSSPLPTRQYSRQYAALYDFRLRKLRRSRLLQKAKERWEGTDSTAADAAGGVEGKKEKRVAAGIRNTPRILDVKKGEVTYVSGIVYVEMRLKPDVLSDLSREQYLPPLPPVSSYSDATSDSVYLEDESGRLKLVGPILMDVAHRGLFVTGTVGAFLGTERENGEFHVQDVCWPGLPTRETSKATVKREQMEENSQGMTAENQEREDDEYVVLMSGLDLGGATGDGGQLGFAAAEMRLSLLTEWIGGEIGDEEHRRKSSRIAGIVVAGNLMATQRPEHLSSSTTDSTTPNVDAPTAGPSTSKTGSSSAAKTSRQSSNQAAANLSPTPADLLLSHLVPLSASLPIVLMPGATDPASAALPQQAVHRAVLRGAGKWAGKQGGDGKGAKDQAKEDKKEQAGATEQANDKGEEAAGGLHLYNNPSWIQFASLSSSSSSSSSSSTKILATSGQNLDDILKYLPSPSALAKAAQESQDALNGSEEKKPSGSSGKKEQSTGEDVEMAGPSDSQKAAQDKEEEEEEDDERLVAACRLLEYGHIAPTAPDTLWCFPFTDRDPFLLSTPEQIPEVFLIGNQPRFASTTWRSGSGSERVEVVLVPSFARTGEVAMLNLRTKRVRGVKVGWEM